MKTRIVTVLAGALLLFASASFAIPILNNPGDGFEDRGDGSVYSTYVNSGHFLYVEDGNNEGSLANLLAVQNALNAFLGTNFILAKDPDVTLTSVNDLSGTWTVTPSGDVLSFYAVKASNAYAMYQVIPSEGTGSWSTFDLWNAGHPGNDLEISHFTGYEGTPVPEPGTVLLLGAGIFGLAVFQKRRSNNKA